MIFACFERNSLLFSHCENEVHNNELLLVIIISYKRLVQLNLEIKFKFSLIGKIRSKGTANLGSSLNRVGGTFDHFKGRVPKRQITKPLN